MGDTVMIIAASTLLGRAASALLIADEVTGDPAQIIAAAADLAPFPPARGNYYPGLRRFIGPRDTAAAHYARLVLQRLAPAINAAFHLDGFDLLQASFSIVTARPGELSPPQRAPHFDSTDPRYIAIMHYLGGVEGSGTAFFRQRSTGIERVTDANQAAFVATAQAEATHWHGYIDGSNASFEQIGAVDGKPDRVVAYQGSLLHSGRIPPDMAFSDDPGHGRLTANFFVRGRPRG